MSITASAENQQDGQDLLHENHGTRCGLILHQHEVWKKFHPAFQFQFCDEAHQFCRAFAGIKKQSFGQFITNPMNSFGLNPKYKWAELQLGYTVFKLF